MNPQKKEAIKRMMTLGIFPGIVKQFVDEDLVSYSEEPFGACYWLNDEMEKRKEEIEEKYGILIYHMIPCTYDFGHCEAYLYVGKYEEEWEMEQAGTVKNRPMAYVYNLDNPVLSEFGHISVELTPAAGLRRIE